MKRCTNPHLLYFFTSTRLEKRQCNTEIVTASAAGDQLTELQNDTGSNLLRSEYLRFAAGRPRPPGRSSVAGRVVWGSKPMHHGSRRCQLHQRGAAHNGHCSLSIEIFRRVAELVERDPSRSEFGQ